MPCDGGLEADALDFQLLDKAFADALDHIVDEGAAQAVQGLGLGVVAVAADKDVAAVNFRLVRRGNSKSSLPLGPSTKTFWPLTSTLTFGGTATGYFPIRDIINLIYQTSHSNSPPRFFLRACVPVMMPSEVETIEMPRPPRTRGISVAPT